LSGYEDYFSDIFFLCERDCSDGDNSKQSCIERILSSPPPCVSHLDKEERKRIVDSLYSPKNISLYGGYLEEGLNETHFVSGSELSQKAKEDIKKLKELCNICCESLKKYPLHSLSQKKALPLIKSCITNNYSTLAPERVGYLSEYILERFLLD
jgi:hypothetical protein